MTLNGAIMELVMLREHPMMPLVFHPSLDKIIETVSECKEPTEQPEKAQLSQEDTTKDTTSDLISRQAVDKIIDDLLENDNLQASPSVWHGLYMIKQLPSAQPVATDTNVGDKISRQAAIEALQKCRKHCIDPFDSYHIDINDAECRLSEVPSAQSEQQWIPVSERLPEDNGRYFVSIKRITWNCKECIETDIAYWSKLRGFHKSGEVIAWIPLPEPYKESEGE